MSVVFFSYSHADEEHRDRVEKALSMLKREGAIQAFHDRRIPPGANLDHTIKSELERADVILLLVSPDFLASEYCYDKEMTRALERHANREAAVIPIIVRPCEWHRAPFKGIMALPPDGKAMTKFADMDDALLTISTGVRQAIDARSLSGMISVATPEPASRAPNGSPGPRSSNLRIRRTFSDIDRDQFQDGAFDFIARYFENSVEELAARHKDVKGVFKRSGTGEFTVYIYLVGAKAAYCRVFMDRSSLGGIAYSAVEGMAGGLNESLSVVAHDDGMFLKSLGMSTYGRDDGRLTYEGGAELYWNLLIERLR